MKRPPHHRPAASRLPEEKCENCGKVIKGTGKANVLNERVLCTPCWKLLSGHRTPNRPATGRQIEFLRNLGFPNVDGLIFDEAGYTLSHAQEIRYFAFQVARQEWNKDLQGFDLRPLVHAIFADPKMHKEIYETMGQREEATYKRQDELQAIQLQNMDDKGRLRDSSGRFSSFEATSLRDCAPDLEKNLNYCKVRDGLMAMFGENALKPKSLLTWITRFLVRKTR